jgi:hypothetical protein
MSRPFWQARAETAYALLLHLYPRRVRERHGEEMRQAFRDRCREAAQRGQSAWRLFCLELAPDFTASVATSHFEGPSMKHPRIALIAFTLLGCTWFFHDALSQRFLDAYFASALQYRHWQEERAFARDEARVRALADQLAGSKLARERSLAAYLYALNYSARSRTATYLSGANMHLDFEPVAEDGARATKLIASLPQSSELEAARLALSACEVQAGCPRLARAEALARAEPANAYAWSQLLELHAQAGDERSVREDLRHMADSSVYRDGLEGVEQQLVSYAMHAAPGDAATAAALGRQLDYSDAVVTHDFSNSVFHFCAFPRADADFSGEWLRQHPEALPDCRQAATLLTQSSLAWQAFWGARWLEHDLGASDGQQGRARQKYYAAVKARNAIGRQGLGGYRWRPWTDGEWLQWAQAYTSVN